MTTFHIKIFAIVFMLLDHLGYFFFPDNLQLRLIGRLSFPLFAWLIANGAYHTHDISRYFLRLSFFALLTQIPFYFVNRFYNSDPLLLNIYFTLALGLLGIIMFQKIQLKNVTFLLTILLCIIAQLINVDYGAFGVAMIIIFYLFYERFFILLSVQTALFVLHSGLSMYFHNPIGIIEFVGLLSFVFIFLYNKKEGPKMKYAFYLIYPLQYIIILLLNLWG